MYLVQLKFRHDVLVKTKSNRHDFITFYEKNDLLKGYVSKGAFSIALKHYFVRSYPESQGCSVVFKADVETKILNVIGDEMIKEISSKAYDAMMKKEIMKNKADVAEEAGFSSKLSPYTKREIAEGYCQKTDGTDQYYIPPCYPPEDITQDMYYSDGQPPDFCEEPKPSYDEKAFDDLLSALQDAVVYLESPYLKDLPFETSAAECAKVCRLAISQAIAVQLGDL